MVRKEETKSRRGRGEGSITQRADGYWVGVIDLGWHNGRHIRKTASGTTKKILMAKFKKLQDEISKGGGLTEDVNVEEWLNHWLETIASERVRERTLQGYKSYVDIWLIPYLGKYRLNKLNEDHIRALYRMMKDEGKSDATRRQAHAILRRSLVVAMREGRITRNPAANIDAPKVSTNHRLPLTLDQAKRVLANLDGDPLAARWVAALLLGLRQGEALGLKWEDVDLFAGTIKIRRELLRITGKGLVETPPKSATSIRTIPLPDLMNYALENIKERGEYVFYGIAKDPKQDWKAWKELLVKSGVCEPDTAYGDMPELASARTTTATLLRDLGTDVTVIRDILGHSQVQVTQESYQRTDLPTKANAMKALGISLQT